MTVGMFEWVGLLIIWFATMITLTVMTVCDAIRRRRQWHRGIRALGNAVQRARR